MKGSAVRQSCLPGRRATEEILVSDISEFMQWRQKQWKPQHHKNCLNTTSCNDLRHFFLLFLKIGSCYNRGAKNHSDKNKKVNFDLSFRPLPSNKQVVFCPSAWEHHLLQTSSCFLGHNNHLFTTSCEIALLTHFTAKTIAVGL